MTPVVKPKCRNNIRGLISVAGRDRIYTTNMDVPGKGRGIVNGEVKTNSVIIEIPRNGIAMRPLNNNKKPAG